MMLEKRMWNITTIAVNIYRQEATSNTKIPMLRIEVVRMPS